MKKITDRDGIEIKVGSVLKNIKDSDRGVVVVIPCEDDAGKWYRIPMNIGDIDIKTGRGTNRVTNIYKEWVHIPREEQTYMEKYESWLVTPFESNEISESISVDEELAVQGILALLPEDIYDHEYGPFPDRIGEALGLLAEYLTELSKDKYKHDGLLNTLEEVWRLSDSAIKKARGEE